jgi:hypothetical protein
MIIAFGTRDIYGRKISGRGFKKWRWNQNCKLIIAMPEKNMEFIQMVQTQ